MKNSTAQALIALNTTFYETVGSSFDTTRKTAWTGWSQLHPYIISRNNHLNVLDIACGNARFAEFLVSHIDSHTTLDYKGIDGNQILLDSAESNLAQLLTDSNSAYSLEHTNIFQEIKSPSLSQYDLVVCFGFAHHTPTHDLRREFLHYCLNQTSIGGFCIISFWQFTNNPNLMKRALTQPDTSQSEIYYDLDPYDYILDWQRDTPPANKALRYCHFWSKDEVVNTLAQINSCNVIDCYYADGKSNAENLYIILQKT